CRRLRVATWAPPRHGKRLPPPFINAPRRLRSFWRRPTPPAPSEKLLLRAASSLTRTPRRPPCKSESRFPRPSETRKHIRRTDLLRASRGKVVPESQYPFFRPRARGPPVLASGP